MLKRSDFGDATVFRHQTLRHDTILRPRDANKASLQPRTCRHRVLRHRLCGHGDQRIALETNHREHEWKDNDIEQSVQWIRDNLLLSMIKKILTHSPSTDHKSPLVQEKLQGLGWLSHRAGNCQLTSKEENQILRQSDRNESALFQ